MLPSSPYYDTQLEYCEKIANEVFKYEVLMKKKVKKNYDVQRKLQDAYQELARTFYLTTAMSGYKLLEHLVKFCLEMIYMKVRENLYQSEYGVLSTCPKWVQALDKPLGLMQIVYKQYRKSKKTRLATCLFSYELLAAVKRAIDDSSRGMRHLVLLKAQSVRSHALSLGLPVLKILDLWKKMYKVSVLKLDYLLEAGDITGNVKKSLQLSKIEKNILDLGLLYDLKIRVVKRASFLIDEKLNAMILLYKLMVAARESYCYVKQNGFQTGAATICQNSGNLVHNDENLLYYQNVETVEMWALVYLEYLRCGFDASFVLLQKRWYEMKSLTRRLLHPSVTRKNQVPHILLVAMTKRFPYIISDELPSWFELRNTGKIYTDSDISALPDEWKNMPLNVKENVNVNDILEELCEESQEDVQVIETELDAIDVDHDSDSDGNDYSESYYSNHLLNNDTIMSEDIQESITEPEIKRTLAPKFGNTDVNIKTTIILDEDFDINKELKMFKMKQNNSASTNNAFGKKLSVIKEPILNMDTDMNGTLDENVSDDIEDTIPRFDIKRNEYSSTSNVKQPPFNDDYEQNNENSEVNEESIIDKKLLLLPKVVLTPVEKTSLWQKFSRDNTNIQCRSVSTQKKTYGNKSRLKMATPQVTQSNNEKSNPNTKSLQKIKAMATEDKDIRKQLQNKRKFLMRHLKLSKTSYSKEFWSERNINLLEQCKPVSVTLNKVTRVAKKVELSDIDEIRRINKTILTAQVAPMTYTKRNERTECSSNEKMQQNNVDQENAKEKEKNINNNSSNSETSLLVVNEEKKNMFKKIVVKKYTSNPTNNEIHKTPMTEYEIECLNNNINKHICQLLDELVNRDCKIPMKNRKPRNRTLKEKESEENSKEDVAFNSIDEWQRQKNFTRKYFHLKPVSDVNNIENNNKQKQNSSETKQYDSDDTNLVIDEDINIENKAFNKATTPLKDMADISVKKESNETNNGVSEISQGISTNSEIFGTHKIKAETNNGVSEISNGISKDSEMFGNHKVKTEIDYEVPITNEIFVSKEIFNANYGITDINPGISYNNIKNEINDTDLDMSRDDSMDLIVISSDDDDDVKPIINDNTKLNENVIKSSNNGTSVPKLVKILPKPLQNPTIGINNHNVINLLSKVAYNIKSKTQNVQTFKSHPPPLQLIETVKRQNKIKNVTPLLQQPTNSPNTTYYLIKVPSEKTPDSFPLPVIQSVESLSSEQKVVITKTKKTPPPIIYNDLLRKDESPQLLRSLLTNTDIVSNVSMKVVPVKVHRLKPSLVHKKK